MIEGNKKFIILKTILQSLMKLYRLVSEQIN